MVTVDPAKTLYVPTRAAWRKWLAKNHDRATEIWLIDSAKKEETRARRIAEAIRMLKEGVSIHSK